MILDSLVYGALILFFGFLAYVALSKKSDAVPASVLAVRQQAALATPGMKTILMSAIAGGNGFTLKQNQVAAINAIRNSHLQHDVVGARYIVEHLPQVVFAQLPEQQAESVRQQLQAAGLTVTVEDAGQGAAA